MSKDSMLLLLHDATLDRTTTGKGPVNQLTWKELQTLELKDESNNLLKGQRIPTAEEILTTAHGKIMLALDVKPGTDLTRTMALIEKTNTLNDVFIICYTIADAQKLNKLYPTLKLALGFNDHKSIATIQQAGIPYKNLLALTPQKLQEKSFYKKIHEMGILTSVGTYGNVDTLPNKKALKEYKRILKYGGDIITADSASKVTMMFNKRK
jgi:glycerophosphoryl diester phosphodiesterase